MVPVCEHAAVTAADTLPPGPRAPAWVNFGRYLRDPLGMMEGLRRDHGPVAFVPFPGGHGFYFVSDAALVRRGWGLGGGPFRAGRGGRGARRRRGGGRPCTAGGGAPRPRRPVH